MHKAAVSAALGIAILAFTGAAAKARAGECPAMIGGSAELSGIDADLRLEYIHSHLLHEAKRAHIWSWTWTSIYATASAGTLVEALVTTPDKRIDGWVNSGSALIGALSIPLLPLHVMGDAHRLDVRIARAGGGGDRCALLAEAERLLVRDAESEAFGKSPLIHIAGFLFNLGAGLVLGFGFHHWTAAEEFIFPGIVAAEIQIISQPNRLPSLLEEYRAGNLGHAPARSANWQVAPMVGQQRYGLSFGLTF